MFTPAIIKCFALNYFGTGGHPHADAESLEFFPPAYVRECLARAIASEKVADAAKEAARSALEEIGIQ